MVNPKVKLWCGIGSLIVSVVCICLPITWSVTHHGHAISTDLFVLVGIFSVICGILTCQLLYNYYIEQKDLKKHRKNYQHYCDDCDKIMPFQRNYGKPIHCIYCKSKNVHRQKIIKKN